MKNLTSLILTITTLMLVTLLTIFYSEGWRINLGGNTTDIGPTRPSIIQTGMIAVRSIPEAAKVYLNKELITATDDTIAALKPGKYTLTLQKEGFETWEKEIEVLPELVTDITAVLVLQSPRLEPLTNTDVKAFALSANQNNIAFLTKNHEEPGIWQLPFADSAFNLFRNNTKLLIPDTVYATPSFGEKIWWSPNDKEIVVQLNQQGYLLYRLREQNTQNIIPLQITNIEVIFKRWQSEWEEEFLQPKLNAIEEKQDIPSEIGSLINNTRGNWSPDEEKFFVLKPSEKDPGLTDVIVYNSEDPLPVGERRVTYPLQIANPDNIKIYWYSDSYHLVTVEQVRDRENYFTISLVRIDGTNPTVIYTGTLASNQAAPTPDGSRIVVLTSLKEGSANNLYSVAIR